ncbi:hypothetical protein CW358_20220 [Pseudomonas protegens]|nr:hypothetical protein CW358_20220 [Pseudomonas protegens]
MCGAQILRCFHTFQHLFLIQPNILPLQILSNCLNPLPIKAARIFLLAFYAFTIYVQIEFLVSDSLDFNKIFPR